MPGGRGVVGGAVRHGPAPLLRALDGHPAGPSGPTLRRILFGVMCAVVLVELLVILAVGTHHARDAGSTERRHATVTVRIGADATPPADLRLRTPG